MALDTNPSSTGVLLSSDDKGSPIPTVFFDMITLDEAVTDANYIGDFQNSNLVINLKMNIAIPLDAMDEDILDNLNVCVARCTNARDAENIAMTGEIRGPEIKKIYEGPIQNLLKGQDLDASGLREESTYEASSGKKIFNLFFQQEEKIRTSKVIPHLSYYAFCYLDLESLVGSLGLQDLPSVGPTIGPLTGENVILNGKVNATSYVYFVTSPHPKSISGTYWTGPVRQDDRGNWKAAKWVTFRGKPILTSTEPAVDLERIEVRNTKIQDYRFIKQIPSFNFDLIPSKFMPITIKGNNNFNNSIQNPDAYISNAFLTRDTHNNCRFMFEFDFHRALIKESKFGKILTNPFVPEETKKKIYNYSPITNLKIIRRRVDTVRGYNRLSSTILGIAASEIDLNTDVIVETSSDRSNNNTLKKVAMFSPMTGKGSRREQVKGQATGQVGSIMELKSLSGSPKQTRTIAVTDSSASELQNGTFQYGVKIEMEDGSVRFLNERLKRLRTLRDYLEGYYQLKQIPEKVYQTITGVVNYYDIIFSERVKNKRLRQNFNRGNFSTKSEINKLRTEQGFLIGNLDPRETLYPWVIVPEYLVDTLESISDFSYITKSQNIDTTPAIMIQSPAAVLDSPADSSSGILGRLSGPTNRRTEDSTSSAGARDYGIGRNTGASVESFERIGRETDIQTSAQMRAIDFFDEKAARFSLRTLLDPRSATSESILQVIGIIDMVTQKIRTMMGSSAQIEELKLSLKQRGVSRNSKVSVLNLEDYFIELFDARLSSMPIVDYVGFRNSLGFVNPVDNGPFEKQAENGTRINAMSSAQKAVKSSAGPQGMDISSWSDKLRDEQNIDDLIDQSHIQYLMQMIKKFRDQANNAMQAGNPELAASLREKADYYEKILIELKKLLEEQSRGDTSSDSTATTSEDRKKQKGWRRKRHQEQQERSVSQDRDAPPEASRPEPKQDNTYLTPTVFKDRAGTELMITAETLPSDEDLVRFQNTTVAANSGNGSDAGTTAQDTINAMMTNAGVESMSARTPYAAQDLLTTGQARVASTVDAGDILGRDDQQTRGSTSSQINTCSPGLDGGDGSEDLQRCKNQTSAQGMFQTVMNMFAENGSLNQVFERAQGNPSMLKNLYKKMKNEKQNRVNDSIYGSAKERLIYEKMAKVTVFVGYEKDKNGDIMIKRPIFKSPSNWEQLIRKINSPSNSNDIILCKIEANPDAPPGLQMVEANAYFMITKGKNTLITQNETGKRRKVDRDKIEKIARERDIPPEALRSLYINKTGGRR